MRRSRESFREEHGRLGVGVERLRALADMVGEVSPATLRAAVEDVYRFLSHRLLPHMSVEERVLYPAIARARASARLERSCAGITTRSRGWCASSLS